jgi:acetyl esterase/lipase
VVPDPRPGDLETTPDGDTLREGYVAPPAAQVLRDEPYVAPADPVRRLDLYLPERQNGVVIAWIHAGGWTSGDKSPVPSMLLRQVTRAGFAIASINYRLARYDASGRAIDAFPAAADDVAAAVRWIKSTAPSRGVRADKVILTGGSAGGHLAAYEAAVAAASGDAAASVSAVVDFVGPVDLVALANDSTFGATLASTFMGCARPTAENPRTCSDDVYARGNVPAPSPSVPPAYFAYGADDTLVVPAHHGALLALAWADAKGARTGAFYDQVEGAGHNLDGHVINTRALESFLDAVAAGSL